MLQASQIEEFIDNIQKILQEFHISKLYYVSNENTFYISNFEKESDINTLEALLKNIFKDISEDFCIKACSTREFSNLLKVSENIIISNDDSQHAVNIKKRKNFPQDEKGKNSIPKKQQMTSETNSSQTSTASIMQRLIVPDEFSQFNQQSSNVVIYNESSKLNSTFPIESNTPTSNLMSHGQVNSAVPKNQVAIVSNISSPESDSSFSSEEPYTTDSELKLTLAEGAKAIVKDIEQQYKNQFYQKQKNQGIQEILKKILNLELIALDSLLPLLQNQHVIENRYFYDFIIQSSPFIRLTITSNLFGYLDNEYPNLFTETSCFKNLEQLTQGLKDLIQKLSPFFNSTDRLVDTLAYTQILLLKIINGDELTESNKEFLRTVQITSVQNFVEQYIDNIRIDQPQLLVNNFI